jgi:ABC-type Fe3+ transport system permease subunit
MKSTSDQIEDIKNHGYSLDFSTVFNHAFENYKKIALYSGLIILVFSFIFLFAFFSVLVAYYGVESMSKDFFENLENQKLSYIEQLISTLGISLLSGVLAPFGAGFLKMADCADKDQEFNVSTILLIIKRLILLRYSQPLSLSQS